MRIFDCKIRNEKVLCGNFLHRCVCTFWCGHCHEVSLEIVSFLTTKHRSTKMKLMIWYVSLCKYIKSIRFVESENMLIVVIVFKGLINLHKKSENFTTSQKSYTWTNTILIIGKKENEPLVIVRSFFFSSGFNLLVTYLRREKSNTNFSVTLVLPTFLQSCLLWKHTDEIAQYISVSSDINCLRTKIRKFLVFAK